MQIRPERRVSQLLYELINQLGRAEVARQIGVDESVLSRYLSGEVGIKLDRLDDLFDLAERNGIRLVEDIGADIAEELEHSPSWA